MDITARRTGNRAVNISELVVEVEKSASDPIPYVDTVITEDTFGRLTLVNEGWSDVKSATFEFDVIGSQKPDDDKVRALTTAKRDGGYAYKALTGPFQGFAFLNLEAGLSKALPNFAYYKYAYDYHPWDAGHSKPPTPPTGYERWAAAHPEIIQENWKHGRGAMWVVGRLIVEGQPEGAAPVVADLLADVNIYYISGFGGGGISYVLGGRLDMRTQGEAYTVRRKIGYLLDDKTPTWRAFLYLIVDRTSRHRFRVILRGDGSKDLFVSDWIDAHIVVPRSSKKIFDPMKASSKR
jgi:hypothetical protein